MCEVVWMRSGWKWFVVNDEVGAFLVCFLTFLGCFFFVLRGKCKVFFDQRNKHDQICYCV